jgi:CheY-like chemotaxis protein
VKPRILVVDDDPDVVDAMVDTLASEGYRVATASDGKVALETMGSHRFDLVILDLMMPVMNGWEFLEHKLRDERLKHVPVLLATASDASGPSKLERVVGVMRKPLDAGRLLGLVAQAFEIS